MDKFLREIPAIRIFSRNQNTNGSVATADQYQIRWPNIGHSCKYCMDCNYGAVPADGCSCINNTGHWHRIREIYRNQYSV